MSNVRVMTAEELMNMPVKYLPTDPEVCSQCPQGVFCMGIGDEDDSRMFYFECSQCKQKFLTVRPHWDAWEGATTNAEFSQQTIDARCPRVGSEWGTCDECVKKEQF